MFAVTFVRHYDMLGDELYGSEFAGKIFIPQKFSPGYFVYPGGFIVLNA